MPVTANTKCPFDAAVSKLIDDADILPEEHAEFVADVDIITNKINEHMKDSEFKELFSNLKSVAMRANDPKHFDLPDVFNSYLFFKLPFKVVLRHLSNNRNVVVLVAKDVGHPFIHNSFVHPTMVRQKLKTILELTIPAIPVIACPNSRSYKLFYSYISDIGNNRHVIKASNSTNEILFIFLEAIEFSYAEYVDFPIYFAASGSLFFVKSSRLTIPRILDPKSGAPVPEWDVLIKYKDELTDFQKAKVRNVYRLLNSGISYKLKPHINHELRSSYYLMLAIQRFAKEPLDQMLIKALEHYMKLTPVFQLKNPLHIYDREGLLLMKLLKDLWTFETLPLIEMNELKQMFGQI